MKSGNKIGNIGIIGAGSAGLAAAVSAGRMLSNAIDSHNWNIDLIEKNSHPGKKLLATGNGKCNLTNSNSEDFGICRDFFNGLGIILSEENDGRMYPYSRQASTVCNTLSEAALFYGVNILTDKVIEDVSVQRNKRGNVFRLRDNMGKTAEYHRLIIATGGKAGSQYGSDGSGIVFARSLEIGTEALLPVLVPMVYGDNPGFDLPSLKGVRAKVRLILRTDGWITAEEDGELQFTQYGLSGICIFNLTRHLKNASKSNNRLNDCAVEIDFVPDYSREELGEILGSGLRAGLKGLVNEKIEKIFLKSGLDPAIDSTRCAKYLKSFPVSIQGTKGWKEAQVTSGGVSLNEIDMNSMESKKIPGLFFAGEVLDYDGPCGGYNLTWAWRSGIQAGLCAADSFEVDI